MIFSMSGPVASCRSLILPSNLPTGIAALHLSGLDDLLACGSASSASLYSTSIAEHGELFQNSKVPVPASIQAAAWAADLPQSGLPSISPSHQHAAPSKLQQPKIDVSVVVAFPQPLRIAATLTTLVVGTEWLSSNFFTVAVNG